MRVALGLALACFVLGCKPKELTSEEKREKIKEEMILKRDVAREMMAESRMPSNEKRAVSGLRAYLGAQGTFQRVDRYNKEMLVYANPKDGTGFPDLYQIGIGRPGSAADASAMKLIDLAFARATSPATAKAGYYYVDITSEVGLGDYEYSNACGLCAVPAQHGKTGLNTFIVDLTGVVYKKDTGGRPVTVYPDTTKDGWVPATN
jgi:hypothetical protein